MTEAAPTKLRSVNFRPFDDRLFDALDRLTEQRGEFFRRSRNDAMNLLLEEALKALGLWPPPEAEAGEAN